MAYDPHNAPLFAQIATALQTYKRCLSDDANASQQEWAPKWRKFIVEASAMLPQGSGFDIYPQIDIDGFVDGRHSDRFTVTGEYHNMDSNGSYSGWTAYRIAVRPDWNGITLTITGAGRGDLADYIHEAFHTALTRDYSRHAFYETGAPMPTDHESRKAVYQANATGCFNGLSIRYVPDDQYGFTFYLDHSGLTLSRFVSAAHAADALRCIVNGLRDARHSVDDTLASMRERAA